MSKTHKQQGTRFDDEHKQGRGGKHHRHSNNVKFHGMRIHTVWVDEYFDVNKESYDSFDINKSSDEEL